MHRGLGLTVRYGDVLGYSRVGASIHIYFTLYVDVFQLKAMVSIIEFIALFGMPFKFENIFKLHLAGLTIV